MPSTDQALLAFNAGEVGRLALARVDLAKMRIACEVESNWLPHVLGPAMMRPGTQYIAGVAGDAPGWLGEFYFSEAETALPVMTAAGLQFLINDAYLTRGAVTAAIANGGFNTDLSGWTQNDEAGATSSWNAGALSLVGTGDNYAFRDQQVTVHEPNTEHALRIIVQANTIVLRVGVSMGAIDYLDVLLRPGTYSLAFTPTGNFWVQLGASSVYAAYVDSIQIEAAGIVSLPVPYSGSDFGLLRYDQSGNVIFAAAAGKQQRRIERWGTSRSWGLALYQADDGPFLPTNNSSTTLTPSATTGSAGITANRPVFRSGHVGALFRITQNGQQTVAALAALNSATGNIRVSGLAAHSGNASQRAFTIIIDGTFVATIDLQRSLGAPGSWTTVNSYTAPASETYDDGLDNQIIYYRLHCSAYTSGSANCQIVYNASSQTGIIRITAVSGPTSATADILQELGGTSATDDWAEGEWSDFRGWPAAVVLHDGRLFWGPSIKVQGSVSDAFASFDDTTTGDSAPINRTVATGGLDGVRWMLSLQRLLVGTAGQEISIRASAFDEPLTPTAFTARAFATQGAAKVRALRIDTAAIYVERNGQRVFEALYEVTAGDYRSKELTRLKQEMCAAGIVDVAVQRQPDTRVWFVLADGTCAVLTYDAEDEVRAWTPVVTSGSFERVAVLPGTDEDGVYFIVARTVSATTKRFIEKLAKRSEARGGALSKTSDCHVVYSGAPATVITGLSHLEGRSVVAWADGAAVAGTFTVASGQITLPAAASNAVVGLAYTATLKTTKLAFGAEHGTALTMPKRIAGIGLVMADVSVQGVRVGRDFSNLRGLSATYRGKAVTPGQVLAAYDARPACFAGGWDSDSRVCVQVASPHCCTLMGLTLHEGVNESVELPPASRDHG